MSDFYRQRRGSIRDVTSYAAFLVGFVAAAPYGWGLLSDDVAAYNFPRGIMRFVLVIFGSGTLFGIVGIALGSMFGMIWEFRHKRGRGQLVAEGYGDLAQSSRVAAPKHRRAVAGPSLAYSDAGFDAHDFLALAQRVWPKDYDSAAAAEALTRTINIGAWENDRLVGAVRVLTDGYFLATVPEILVDPTCRKRGIGRELMRRALDASPKKTLFFGAPMPSRGFFDRLGAEPGPIGLTLRGEGWSK